MKMSKSMVEMMLCLARSMETLPKIAKESKLSINRCSELATRLEKAGLASKSRSRKGLRLRLANSSPAESFRKMYLAMPHMRYGEFLYGNKLEILKLILYEEKSVKTLARISGIKERTIRENLRQLGNPQLYWRKKGKYSFPRQGYPLLFDFLGSLRNFTSENKRILWKCNEEELFKVRDAKFANGCLTGLNAYGNFGVVVNTIEYFCSQPCNRLSKNEVFVHSMLEIKNEPRILGMAIAFYLKNSMEKENIGFLLSKYDCVGAFREFKRTIDEYKNSKSELIKNTIIPSITLREIERILDIYGVKDVRKRQHN